MHVWSSNNFEAAVTAANKTLIKFTEKNERETWNQLKEVIILGPNKTFAGLQLLLFS